MKKKIVILFPTHSRYPIGGFKVVYEYANYLVKNGFEITIIYPGTLLWKRQGMKEKIMSLCRYIYYSVNRKYVPYEWFPLDKDVKLNFTLNLLERNIPTADIYMATSMETAIYLNTYKKNGKSAKFYFIQGYETWNWGETCLLETWKYPMHKIVIADWLKEKIERVGEEADLVYNGFDFNEFQTKIPAERKNKYSICMLYHHARLKGCEIGVDALKIVKEKYPQIIITFFGIPDRPDDLPIWIIYEKNPSIELLNNIYNSSAIFVGPSQSEGFCLTIGEAMQCSCAVACTNIGGYGVLARHEDTALLCDVNDTHGLANNIIKLIDDDKLRLKISQNGHSNILTFTWERAFKRMENILKNICDE